MDSTWIVLYEDTLQRARFHPSAYPSKYTHPPTGLFSDIEYTVFVTSETDITDFIPVKEVFILARGDTLVQSTGGIATELLVGVTVSVVAVVFTAIAVISVVSIACVCYKKRVKKIEIELQELQMVQVNTNLSYGQATQSNDCIVETIYSDGQYEIVNDFA